MIGNYDKPVLFVGAGKMGGAMLAGLLEEGLDPALLTVQDPGPPPAIADLLSKYELEAVARPPENLAPSVIILSVKPQVMEAVLPPLAPLVSADTLVVSIAAGRTLASLEKHVGADKAVVRAMPNTPAEIGRAMTVLCPNANIATDQRDVVEGLLGSIGDIAWVSDEADMDAVTALSGSGPAYVFWLTECMAHAGMDAGLEEEQAWKLARATVSGAAELMRTSEHSPSQLRENVTSPAGTTEAALKVLMAEDGLKPLMSKAIASAKNRSRELSE